MSVYELISRRFKHGAIKVSFNFSSIHLLLLLFLLPYAAIAQSDTTDSTSPSGYDPYAPRAGPQFNPSMAIIMVALVSAFFVMGFFSVYIRHCTDRRIAGSGVSIGGIGRLSRRTTRGLDIAIIETFPTFVYSAVKELKIGKESLECAVCLNEFEDDETLRLIPVCNHVFHPVCIDAWLSSKTTCPVCRANLVPKPGETVSFRHPFQFQNPSMNTGQPEQISDQLHQNNTELDVIIPIRDDQRVVEPESNETNLNPSPAENIKNRAPRSKSSPWRLSNIRFPRSHSTGHSLVQPGDNCERFTLRLPAEVRSQLVSFKRTKSCVAFPRARSSTTGYRGENGSGKNYERFDGDNRLDRWEFTMTPPFFLRTGSHSGWMNRSKNVAVGGEDQVRKSPPMGLFKSPFDRFLHGRKEQDDGERSSDRLRHDDNDV